jgi:hypothetical protein
MRVHGMPPHLLEGVRSFNNCIKDPTFHLDLVTFEVQGDTVFPHEHGAEDDIIPINVDDVKVMIILRFTNFKIGKYPEVYLLMAANCSQLQGHRFF